MNSVRALICTTSDERGEGDGVTKREDPASFVFDVVHACPEQVQLGTMELELKLQLVDFFKGIFKCRVKPAPFGLYLPGKNQRNANQKAGEKGYRSFHVGSPCVGVVDQHCNPTAGQAGLPLRAA